MHEFDTLRQQFVNAVAHDGVGLAATNLHQYPRMACNLADLSRQGQCNALVAIFIKIFHVEKPNSHPTTGEPM
jgi:hypothetical protein